MNIRLLIKIYACEHLIFLIYCTHIHTNILLTYTHVHITIIIPVIICKCVRKPFALHTYMKYTAKLHNGIMLFFLCPLVQKFLELEVKTLTAILYTKQGDNTVYQT